MQAHDTPATAPEPVDLLVDGAVLVTLDPAQPVLHDGALAVREGRIVAVGPAAELRARFAPRERIDGARFVAAPGLVNTHCHITGETLTKGFQPDGLGHVEGLRDWAIPLYTAHDAHEEAVSAQLAALEMLKGGTTAFIEAGSIKHLDEVVQGLNAIGIRGRVGRWTWDRSNAPTRPSLATDVAIRGLEDELARHPSDGRRVAAWPSLVGHTAITDALWQAAAALAERHGTGFTFHMSPVEGDPEYFLANHGRRPIEHLHALGVLGPRLTLAHAIRLDLAEVDLLAASGTSVAHCPTTAMRFAYGATRWGLMPEMLARGVNLCLGTDGANSGSTDLMRAGAMAAGLFKDSRVQADLFLPATVLRMATLHGARALQMEGQIGQLRAGCRADFVLHDTWRPEWRPLLDPVQQLVCCADGRSVHSVWVDGQRVVADYRCTTVDEERLYALAQAAGEALVVRTDTPGRRPARVATTGPEPSVRFH